MTPQRKSATSAEPAEKQNNYSENMQTMRAMGARRFDPIAPDQHKWQSFKAWPLVIRIWAWMVAHTTEYPISSAYAVNQHYQELHIEHVAHELKIDEANARKGWRLGCRMGLWGNRPHAKSKGENYQGKRRLYLYGALDLEKAEYEASQTDPDEPGPEDYEKVCTNLFSGAIWKQIKDRPKTELEKLIAEQRAERDLADALEADVMAATRVFIAQRDSSRYTRWGVKEKPPQPHKFKNGHAEAHAFRQELVGQVYLPALAPVLEAAAEKRFVQTSQKSVQTQEEALYRPPAEVCTGPLSLLPQRDSEIHRREERACGSELTQEALRKPPVEQQSGPESLPAGKGQPELSTEEKAAVALLFTKTQEYQKQFPNTRFGNDLVSAENKADVAWARGVLKLVGAKEMPDFCLAVGVKLGAVKPDEVPFGAALLPNSLGKLPGSNTPAHNPHRRYLGLILELAADWKRGAGKRAEAQAEQKAANERVRARRAEVDRRAREQEERWQQVEKSWAGMSDVERRPGLALAEADCKADPMANRLRGEHRQQWLDLRAKQRLRDEMFPPEGAQL